MSVIGRLNDNMLPADGSKLDGDQAENLNQLEEQLLSLRQYLVLHGQLGSEFVEETILKTAELYRLAALVYLERACRRKSRASVEVTSLVNNALSILEGLQICTVMWPLFIVACEAQSDSQRFMVLQAFERTLESRKADNIAWNKKLVEGIWRQDDLFTYSHVTKAAQPMLRYGSIMSASSQLPSFW